MSPLSLSLLGLSANLSLSLSPPLSLEIHIYILIWNANQGFHAASVFWDHSSERISPMSERVCLLLLCSELS